MRSNFTFWSTLNAICAWKLTIHFTKNIIAIVKSKKEAGPSWWKCEWTQMQGNPGRKHFRDSKDLKDGIEVHFPAEQWCWAGATMRWFKSKHMHESRPKYYWESVIDLEYQCWKILSTKFDRKKEFTKNFFDVQSLGRRTLLFSIHFAIMRCFDWKKKQTILS